MLRIVGHAWNAWRDYRRRILESELARIKEQQLVLHAILEGEYPPILADPELSCLPFGFRRDELLVYAFYDVTYELALSSVQRETKGVFVRRGDLDDTAESTSGNCLFGRSGYLAVTTERVYFCGDGGGGLRFGYDGLVSVIDRGRNTLVITFVDDSQPGDRWLGQFTLNMPDARFASELVKAMPLWCPRQPGVGFSKSMQ